MRKMGLEPTRYCYHRHLKPARLPIPPLPHLEATCVTCDIYDTTVEEICQILFAILLWFLKRF